MTLGFDKGSEGRGDGEEFRFGRVSSCTAGRESAIEGLKKDEEIVVEIRDPWSDCMV